MMRRQRTPSARCLGLVAGLLLLSLSVPERIRAENEPLARFWLDQQAPAPIEPRHRHLLSAPTRSGPHRPGFSVVRRPAAPVTPDRKTAAQPGFVVAVFGDELGQHVARGLSNLDADDPASAVIDQTGDDGELTRSAIPAWQEAIAAATAKYGHLDAAVVMLGADETGLAMKTEDVTSTDTSSGWRKLYGDQVQQLAEAFRAKPVPLIWVGLPPVSDPDTSRRFLALNAIFRERAAAAGAIYVDIWEAFSDENGQFATSGPDVDGQTAKLRRADGEGFTLAGAKKLASFVVTGLKQVRDRIDSSRQLANVPVDDQKAFDQALEIDVGALIRREAGLPPLPGSDAAVNGSAELQKDGPVTTLTAPPMAQGGHLASSFDNGSQMTAFVAATLAKGVPPPARTGRTDDFAWPRR